MYELKLEEATSCCMVSSSPSQTKKPDVVLDVGADKAGTGLRDV